MHASCNVIILVNKSIHALSAEYVYIELNDIIETLSWQKHNHKVNKKIQITKTGFVVYELFVDEQIEKVKI